MPTTVLKFRSLNFASTNRLHGGQGRNGLAALALRAHYVRLSALRASVEPPTRGFSVANGIA